jgi:hypothetical protein
VVYIRQVGLNLCAIVFKGQATIQAVRPSCTSASLSARWLH